ncbi:FeS cluster insertion protein [Penicillium alfredii]|uniref:FeS cluster insertion protein n=1 Tax=Penicillium alfredii TaxID=1506179 RepID=A0A9W9JU83_9EURO|nr:FeS cluster insertion protein [Penicillium alfredii]KAJ5081735.1 FeS cluster insertion protein [Penicillium alfredii]
MSRPFISSTARRLSPFQHCRQLSTSRPACRLSASSGKLTTRRPSSLAASPAFLTRPSAPRSSTPLSRFCQRYASFSSSTIRPATKVLQNPRTGDEGQALVIEISPRAVERLREITDPSSSPSATKEENPYHHLRITVTSGGCHGFQYMMSLESASKIDAEEDTVFEGEADASSESTSHAAGEAKVVMDEPSLELLSGSTVDYTTELIGSQFKIVDNPRASSNCGCGTSFDVTD